MTLGYFTNLVKLVVTHVLHELWQYYRLLSESPEVTSKVAEYSRVSDTCFLNLRTDMNTCNDKQFQLPKCMLEVELLLSKLINVRMHLHSF